MTKKVNPQILERITHPHPKRNFVPSAVLMKSGLKTLNTARQNSLRAAVSVSTARPINTAYPRPTVNSARPVSNVFNTRRPFNKITTVNNSNFNKRVNTVNDKNVNAARPNAVVNNARPKAVLSAVKGNKGNVRNPQQDLKNKGVIDICSRHMTGNRSYLTDYEEINGGFVAFGDFKLTNESHVLLKVPRKDNMYSVDLKNVVPLGGLTCLFAKATPYESNLWHRRLGHVNFKTMNKLVKGNLLRGLPLKLFEINQTCVACQKGKQHRASRKTKIVSLISQPLQMLHMDLFGLIVVTDDFSRFSWVFFLATKDETSEILKTFITGIENLIDLRVKVIRCDNGTKFKNKVMNQFCEMKGIKREFSVARTPQQNGVAKRKNRTLIEAARTMLADLKLPTTFWAEVVNTACYVQNRVLVIKPHNKTPYELFLGRKPTLSFMRPFGCPVTILNTIDHLGKFDGKADEGFFVGYSTNSKAFRVFNSRTRIVEENLHVQFSENTSNITGSGPNWLFDIDALTKSMNYKLVVVGNQFNSSTGTKACDDAGKARMETIPGKDYILLPLSIHDPPFYSSSKDSPDAGFKPSGEEEKKDAEDLGNKKDDNINNTNNINIASNGNSTNNVNVVSSTVNAGGLEVNVVDPKTSIELLNDPNMPELKDIVYSDDDEDVGAEADINNLDTHIPVSLIPTTIIHKDHPVKQIIGDIYSAPQTRRMTKSVTEQAIRAQEGNLSIERSKLDRSYTRRASAVQVTTDFMVYQMDVKSAFLYGKIEEEVYVCQLLGFEDPNFLDRVYKVEKALYVCIKLPELEDIIFGSTKKSLCTDFEKMMHKFQMSSMGELTFFLGLQVKQKEDGIFISQDKYMTEILNKFGFSDVKTASTPMETHKPLLKDADGEDVDEHLYRSMIGLLMYLTSSRPDIIYLKGQPKLGLWYPKDSPFDLVAYTDSDYARASLDRKSTTGGCQFLGCRLISWKYKKQIVVANSITEAEYIVASNYCGQVLWIQNQLLDYGYNFMQTKIHIDNKSIICIVKNLVFHSKTKHIEIRHHFIRDSNKKKLIQMIKIHTDQNVADLLTKAFDVSRFEYLIASIGMLNL
ncbi:putative ribonuclease H-like domain-containing protein [Tanacetum coccineum]